MQLHFKLQAKGVQTLTRCFNLVQLFVQGRTLFLQLYVRTLRTPHLNLRPSLHFKWHKLEGGAIHQTAIHAKTRCHINVHHLYCPHGRNTTRNSNTQNAIQMPLFHNGVRMQGDCGRFLGPLRGPSQRGAELGRRAAAERIAAPLRMFVSSSGFQLRQRFFSHVARKGFRFGKGVPLSLFGFAS